MHRYRGISFALLFLTGCRWTTPKPFQRDPMIRDREAMPAGNPIPPSATLAEPIAPVRPFTVPPPPLEEPKLVTPQVNATPIDGPTLSPKPLRDPPLAVTLVTAPGPGKSGPYGRGPNDTWLQGTLDRHRKGYWLLRYADASGNDADGGKVRLEAPETQFNGFRDGDTVRIDGERSDQATDGFPLYRVRSVVRIEP